MYALVARTKLGQKGSPSNGYWSASITKSSPGCMPLRVGRQMLLRGRHSLRPYSSGYSLTMDAFCQHYRNNAEPQGRGKCSKSVGNGVRRATGMGPYMWDVQRLQEPSAAGPQRKGVSFVGRALAITGIDHRPPHRLFTDMRKRLPRSYHGSLFYFLSLLLLIVASLHDQVLLSPCGSEASIHL
ncbi:MAG: hypothetical protein ACJAWL_003510 [Motiliproteus sp.]|jgi:hypothetical protein